MNFIEYCEAGADRFGVLWVATVSFCATTVFIAWIAAILIFYWPIILPFLMIAPMMWIMKKEQDDKRRN